MPSRMFATIKDQLSLINQKIKRYLGNVIKLRKKLFDKQNIKYKRTRKQMSFLVFLNIMHNKKHRLIKSKNLIKLNNKL